MIRGLIDRPVRMAAIICAAVLGIVEMVTRQTVPDWVRVIIEKELNGGKD